MASDIEGQDQSEIFDEDNQELQGPGAPAERRTFEELPDVADVTQAAGDADDDAALIAEDLDDEEIVQLEADADMADIEDDDLAGRMGEGFNAEDAGADPGESAAARLGADEAELIDMGDMHAAPAIESRELGAAGPDEVSDEALEDLGYSDQGERPGHNPGG